MVSCPPAKLEDIDLSLFGRVDDKIKGLVRALKALGIDTIGSCEGHFNNPNRWPYPWVTAWRLSDYRELHPIISEYNKTSEVKWIIESLELEPTRENRNPRNIGELIKLQSNAESLAKFLFDNRPYR